MASSSYTTWRPMPTYLYACMLAASNRQSSLERVPYGLECLTQAPTNTAPTPPSMSIRVFKNTMSSHLVFPCFFSASSRARVHSSQGIIDASFPQPRPAKWLFPNVKALLFFQAWRLATS